MVSLAALWIPIVLSAVVVFVASSLIHMLFGYHKNDWRSVPREDDVMAALRQFDIPPGDYMMPRAGSMAAMKSEAFEQKMKDGPVALMTIVPKGDWSMGLPMALWFVYAVVVSLFSAYIASHALAPGAQYLSVFRFVGTTAFMGYSLALAQWSIWYRRNWGTTLLSMFDGLLYALLTAGVFGWLWPH
jgi:hypothetical protein